MKRRFLGAPRCVRCVLVPAMSSREVGPFVLRRVGTRGRARHFYLRRERFPAIKGSREIDVEAALVVALVPAHTNDAVLITAMLGV